MIEITPYYVYIVLAHFIVEPTYLYIQKKMLNTQKVEYVFSIFNREEEIL